MKVEVLYFQGCPNHGPAVERVRTVLDDEGISADVQQIEVNDAAAAEALGFLGSPTIRVNGRDVEPSVVVVPIGLSCRMYVHGPDCSEGVPPTDVIRRAVRSAHRENDSR